ncbi:MAG: 23S rRNA (pseudouridine(1915)-N(3))-methyltransferase RlmH [Firmicutes bacterium]|nr:23S rRNA (pseudouridine(1915)-N(3))-methyltransferase RlmH [Bacillota bacterium]
MKKIEIVAVGRLKEDFFVFAAEEYIKRLGRFCDVKTVELSEVGGKAKESEAILAAVKNRRFWLLDIAGEQLDSESFAALLDKECQGGLAVFVIGGSEGVNEKVLEAAARRISFGKFTYPHRLMRVMLLEQVYRAMTIIEGMPYHK